MLRFCEGSEILNPALGGSEILNLVFLGGIRNSECFLVFLGDQKF